MLFPPSPPFPGGVLHSYVPAPRGLAVTWSSSQSTSDGEVRAELGGKPDFIIGNHSDGGLVATLISHALGVTQCTIAHTLEKTTHPDADIYTGAGMGYGLPWTFRPA